jgi:hypothetical protein
MVKWWKAGALATLALIVLATLVWAVADSVTLRAVRAEIERIRAAGEPLTFAELKARLPAVPKEEDAADDYAAAIALSDPFDFRALWQAYRTAANAWPPMVPDEESQRAAQQLLADHQRMLELVDRGAGKPHCNYDLGLREGSRALPQFSRFRAAAFVLSLRTLDRVAHGDGDGAADSLISSLRLLRIFDAQPVLIAHLVRLAMWEIDFTSVAAVLQNGHPSDAALRRLQSALAEADAPDQLHRVMLAERVFGLAEMQPLVSGEPPDRSGSDVVESVPARLWGRLWFPWMRARDVLPTLRELARMVQATAYPWPRPLDDVPSANTDGAAMQMYSERTASMLGSVRCAQVAVAIECYRRTHPTRPSALAELLGEDIDVLPPDPFTGGTLRYQQGNEGYVVYSVGSNRVDDGGEVERTAGSQSPDVGIRVRTGSKP